MNDDPSRMKDYKLLGILAVVSLVLVLAGPNLEIFTNIADSLTLPVRKIIWGARVQLTRRDAEISQLRLDLARARAQIAQIGKLTEDNKLLLAQQKITETVSRQKVLAQIVGEATGVAWIDKGSNDQVAVGQVVVRENLIVGRVVGVFDHSARVAMPTSAQFRLAVLVRGAISGGRRADGLLTGLAGQARLIKVLRKDKIAEGDLIVSAGISGEPSGLLIGNLGRVFQGPGGIYQEGDVKLASDLAFPQPVFIII